MAADKYDNGKAPLSLIDRHALEQIAQVLAFGANKYAAHNWRKGLEYSRLLDAALRHLYAFADGEDTDPESGLSHVAHAGACITFLLGMIHARPDMDDRYTAGCELEPDVATGLLESIQEMNQGRVSRVTVIPDIERPYTAEERDSIYESLQRQYPDAQIRPDWLGGDKHD